jgi:Transposase DDE domain.
MNKPPEDGNKCLVSISTLLKSLGFSVVENRLNELIVFSQPHKCRYSPLQLFFMLLIREFRGQSYRQCCSSLSVEDCTSLGFIEISRGEYLIPSPSTLHDFARNRLSVDVLKELMLTIGTFVCKYIRNSNAMIDSTPIEASRYDPYSLYNPHYGIKMDKLHVFHNGEFPLYACFSNGTAHDSQFVTDLAQFVSKMEPHLKSILMDAAYDSRIIRAELYVAFKMNPHIACRENAKYSPNGTELKINQKVNKFWKEGGDIHKKMEEKLLFLCEHDQKKIVGSYLRNQMMTNPDFEKTYKKRTQCERTHAHMKSILDFTVKRLRNEAKELYIMFRFVTYQVMLLARLLQQKEKLQDFSAYY